MSILKKLICFVTLLSTIIPMNVVHAGIGNEKFGLESLDDSQVFTSVYNGPIAEDQAAAHKKLFKHYLELKKSGKFEVNIPAGEALRNSMLASNATVGQYNSAILSQFETSGVVRGGCREISTIISKILTEVGIENYLLYIRETDTQNRRQDKHSANLIRFDGNWIVIDATLELQWKGENSFQCLNIPLDIYENYLIKAFGFTAPHIGIVASSPEDMLNQTLAISLDQFLLINNILRDC